MPKSPLKEYRLELASLLCVLSVFLTVVGVVGVFFLDELPSYLYALEELSEPFGTWVYWFVVLGPILLVGGVWWLYDYIKKSRELAVLIDTQSKARFVRRLDDIEYLAWSLPQRFEDEVLEKKRKLKVK